MLYQIYGFYKVQVKDFISLNYLKKIRKSLSLLSLCISIDSLPGWGMEEGSYQQVQSNSCDSKIINQLNKLDQYDYRDWSIGILPWFRKAKGAERFSEDHIPLIYDQFKELKREESGQCFIATLYALSYLDRNERIKGKYIRSCYDIYWPYLSRFIEENPELYDAGVLNAEIINSYKAAFIQSKLVIPDDSLLTPRMILNCLVKEENYQIVQVSQDTKIALDKEIELDKPRWSLLEEAVTSDDFLNCFHLSAFLGRGGSSDAWQVMDNITGNFYAFVLSQRINDLHNSKLLSQLECLQERNPHLTKIHDYFMIRSIKQLYIQNGESIFPFLYNNEHEALLLELGLGILASQSFKDLVSEGRISEEIINLMKTLNRYILNENRIVYKDDDSDKNYIYVNSCDVYCKGEKMSDYDIWHYKISTSISIYMPKQDYVIKRIDYKDWECWEEESLPFKRRNLRQLALSCEMKEEAFISRFCQLPDDPYLKILEIGI